LSYTTFAYSDLQVSATSISAEEPLMVSVTVTNTGNRAGAEVVQLYVSDVQSTVFRPAHELKGFHKVWLEPGQSSKLSFTLNRRSWAFYDVKSADWVVESGKFEVQIGASSHDIRLAKTIDVSGVTLSTSVQKRLIDEYFDLTQGDYSVGAFAVLVGQPFQFERPRKGTYTLNTPIADMKDSWLARTFHARIKQAMAEQFVVDAESPTGIMFRTIAEEMPLRNLLMLSSGRMTLSRLEALIMMMNGKWIRGLIAFWRSRTQ